MSEESLVERWRKQIVTSPGKPEPLLELIENDLRNYLTQERLRLETRMAFIAPHPKVIAQYQEVCIIHNRIFGNKVRK